MARTNQGPTEISITRTFDAPREEVWKAWTEPERVKQWWGPKGFTAPSAQNDLRVGGKYLYDMLSPEGKHYWSTGTYREVVAPQRIVATDSFADEKGNIVPASYYGMEGDFPLELVATVTFEALDGQTRLTIKHSGFPVGKPAEDARAGWNESLDKLAESLPKKRPATR